MSHSTVTSSSRATCLISSVAAPRRAELICVGMTLVRAPDDLNDKYGAAHPGTARRP